MSEMNIEQTPVLFGPDRALVGMITSPAEGGRAPVACLMLNMGANHRGGPHRINVKLAHRLASMGVSSLRMDLAGLGDSGPARGGHRYLEQCVMDLQAGMDLMQTTLGIQRFAVIGLCSGAAHALGIAVADPRVVGVMMFDGYSFAGRRWYWERALRRALAAPTNPAIVGKTMRWLRRTFTNATEAAPAVNIFTVEQESPAQVLSAFRQSMNVIVDRGVAVYLLYSGTQHVRDIDRDHLGPLAREPFAEKIRYGFSRDIDHTLTLLSAQETFMKEASSWAVGVAAQSAAAVPATPGTWGAPAPAAGPKPTLRSTRRSRSGFAETAY
jgi:pimeloyl-ACP methyl ester carboxylesterase